MKFLPLARLLTVLLLSTGWGASAHAAKVDWSSQVGSPIFADTTDVAAIEIGGFLAGFVPSEDNASEWAAHWVAVGTTQLNPTFRFFSGAVKTDSDLPAELAGTQGFIWLRQSAENTGLLISKADWVWPNGGGLLAAPIPWVADETASVIGALTASADEDANELGGENNDEDSPTTEADGGEIGGNIGGSDNNSEAVEEAEGDTANGVPGSSEHGRNDDTDTPQRDFSGLMIEPDSGRVLGEVKRLTMSRGKAFTARGRIGSESVFFRGSIDGDNLTATSQQPGFTLNGSFNAEGGHIGLEMRNADGNLVAQIDAAPAGAFGSIQRSTLLLLSGDTGDKPGANGFGTLTVSPQGSARLNGVLADGTRFAWTGAASDDHLAFYEPLADSERSISGALRLRNLDGISDFDGQLSQADGGTDDSLRIQGLGSSYSPDAGPAVLARMFGGANAAELVIDDTSFPIEWNADGLGFTGEGIAASFEPSSGVFSGTVGGGATFEGVLFEDQNAGGGQIRGLSGFSPISLRPSSAAPAASENKAE